eukprot:scaffold26619_cov19-Tisochrysis_lutea.AAC.2
MADSDWMESCNQSQDMLRHFLTSWHNPEGKQMLLLNTCCIMPTACLPSGPGSQPGLEPCTCTSRAVPPAAGYPATANSRAPQRSPSSQGGRGGHSDTLFPSPRLAVASVVLRDLW